MTTLHATHMHICMCVKKKVSVCTGVYGTNIRVRRYSRPFIGSKKNFFFVLVVLIGWFLGRLFSVW